MATIVDASTVKATKEHMSSEVEGEVVILYPKSGEYYGLEDVGARVWNLIQEPRMVSDIRDTLLSEYEVKRELCENDLIQFLEELASEGLIEVEGAANP